MLTPRARVEAALRGDWPDQVPFTSYENKFYYCQTERELRNAGLCILEIRVPGYLPELPGMSEDELHYRGTDGLRRIRHVVHTPAGDLCEVFRVIPDDPRIPRQLLPWHEEHFFKRPEDYRPLRAMIEGRRYRENHAAFRRAMEEGGGDMIFMDGLGYSPLQEIIYNVMGLDQFATEWAERRDEVLRLYDALTEDRRRNYAIVADSPALVVSYCGNVSPEVVGPRRFEQYILPHYEELAGMLHARGKLLSVHFDGNCRAIAPAIAGSGIDIVEAFTPAPNSDMSVADARAAWPDKVFWINFPSAVHLEPTDAIEEATRQILREAAPGQRFLIGITETVPVDTWQRSFAAISRALAEAGRLPIAG